MKFFKPLKNEGGWMAIPAIISAVATIASSAMNKGGSKPSQAPTPAPTAASTTPGAGAAGAMAPGSSPGGALGSSSPSEIARLQQLLSGTGQIPTGAPLPQNLQQSIDQQARS